MKGGGARECEVPDRRRVRADVRAARQQLRRDHYLASVAPFLALRSYLPDDHPDKDKEIGSEATPAAFLDVMLALTAEWGRLLAPHGSIAVEIGDTYSGSGGGGGDYYDGGLRAGQPGFTGSASASRDALRDANAAHWRAKNADRDAWPMAKSLAMIPELYAASLAYGRNLLTGEPSPAGRWRVRNFKPWIRSNPPVGALGDKERPATSYITVATRATDRYFDLDAVRTAGTPAAIGNRRIGKSRETMTGGDMGAYTAEMHAAGAPPLDWVHTVDLILDDELAENPGAKGVHLRRRLEQAGILTTPDALDISPKGYRGSHYAVWPPELVKRLVLEMVPRRVCTTCGQPSRRIVDTGDVLGRGRSGSPVRIGTGDEGRKTSPPDNATRTTVGWSDCGHGTWRTGHILDPFAGSGTTLAVATGLGHTADGIDLDERNAQLAQERVGALLLAIHWPAPNYTLPTLPPGGDDYSPWITDQDAERILDTLTALLHTGTRRSSITATYTRPKGRTPTAVGGQLTLEAAS